MPPLVHSVARLVGFAGAASLCALLSACFALPNYPDAERAALARPASALRIVDASGQLMGVRRAMIEAQLRAIDGDGALARHLAIAAAITESPLVVGNQPQILIDGPAAYAAMFAAIESATDHIHIESFIFEELDFGRRLSDTLIAKQRAGVTIRVLYDSVGSISTSDEFLEKLRAGGLLICEFNPVNPLRVTRANTTWRPNHRDHRKILVVDGRVAFTGGINFHQVYRSGSAPLRMRNMPTTQEGWRDTHLRVHGPAVREFQELFMNSWTKQRCDGSIDGDLYPPLETAGNHTMMIVGSSPDEMMSRMYLTLISALAYAQKSIDLTAAYFVPDVDTITALTAAAARGVQVRLLLPGFTDSWLTLHGGRSHYELLLAAGVRIFEHRDALLHAKTVVIDGVWSTIGSSNIDWRSFCHNDEINAIVLGEAFGTEMGRVFADDVAVAFEITAQAWRERSPADRLREWLARRWEQLL